MTTESWPVPVTPLTHGSDLVVAHAPAGEDGRGVLDEELLRLVVEGFSLGRIRLSAGLGDEVIERGVVVPLVVVAALAAEQGSQEVVRVRIVRAPGVPGDRVHELRALDDERVERDALELALDAEVLAPLILHIGSGDLVTRVGVEAERQVGTSAAVAKPSSFRAWSNSALAAVTSYLSPMSSWWPGMPGGIGLPATLPWPP